MNQTKEKAPSTAATGTGANNNIRNQNSILLEKGQAVRTLSDEILSIEIKLERAETVLHETLEDYFENYNSTNKDDHPRIVWEFTRNSVLASIVCDYLCQIRNHLAELREIEIKPEFIK